MRGAALGFSPLHFGPSVELMTVKAVPVSARYFRASLQSYILHRRGKTNYFVLQCWG